MEYIWEIILGITCIALWLYLILQVLENIKLNTLLDKKDIRVRDLIRKKKRIEVQKKQVEILLLDEIKELEEELKKEKTKLSQNIRKNEYKKALKNNKDNNERW